MHMHVNVRFNMSYAMNYERLVNVNNSIEIVRQYIVCKNTLGIIYSDNTHDVVDLENRIVSRYDNENVELEKTILKTKGELELLKKYKKIYRDIEKISRGCLLI